MQLAPESRMASKISSKNRRFDEIFSCAFLHNLSATYVSRLSTKRGLTTKIHEVCASDKFALKFHLSAANRHDAPEGRKLIESLNAEVAQYLLIDRTYGNDETRALVFLRGLVPVVPPKKNRKTPLFYDSEIYKRRNEVERFFLRVKRFRKVFTRYDKVDIVYFSVFTLALIFDALFM